MIILLRPPSPIDTRPFGTIAAPGNEGERFITDTLALPADLLLAATQGVLRLTFRAAADSPGVPPIHDIRLIRPKNLRPP